MIKLIHMLNDVNDYHLTRFNVLYFLSIKITKYFNHKGKTKHVFQLAESSINQIHL